MTEPTRKRGAKRSGRTRRANTRELARAPVARNARGHFLPGVSGNPEGRPRDERELRELARSYGREAIERLVHLMRKAEDERVQLGAAEVLLTRGYGRPVEASGPLVAINVVPGAAAVMDAHEASRVYADLMRGAIDVDAVAALPAPIEAQVSDTPSALGGRPGAEAATDRRVEPANADAEQRRTWSALASDKAPGDAR